MDKLELQFRDEIEKGNLARIRSFLSNTAIWDIDKISLINNLIRIAEENNVFEELDGKIEKRSKSQWNGEYQDSVKTELMLNYSKERFLYFLEVVEYLNSKNTVNSQSSHKNSSSKGTSGQANKKHTTVDNYNKKKVNVIIPIIFVLLVVLLIIKMMMNKQ